MNNVTSLLLNMPFIDDRYQGTVDVSILKERENSSFAVKVEGERIILKTFQGSFFDKIQDAFNDKVSLLLNEFKDMQEIFGDSIARKNYAGGKPQTDEQVEKRIEFNARRAMEGNPFTGFAAIEKTTEKIIGFVALGRGFQNGDSQSALILNPNYTGQKFGKEIALLTGCLAQVYALNEFEVGSTVGKIPVQRFTVTVKDHLVDQIGFIKKLGMERIRSLTAKEAYTDDPASLYGIEACKLNDALAQYLDPDQFSWNMEVI